jgi:hypothetical protein
MDDQEERKRIIKVARSMVERVDATKHEWGRMPSDEAINERLELRQRSKGDLVHETCERAAEHQPVPWQDWIEQRLAQEREHIITFLSEVIGASWRRQRRENKRELADELRTLRIEVANFSAELSELRAIMSAERSGEVIDLPVATTHELISNSYVCEEAPRPFKSDCHEASS